MRSGSDLIKKKDQQPEPAPRLAFEDDEIEPLSGKPYFYTLVQKSHVNSPYQLVLPMKFSRTLPLDTIPMILTRGGTSWEVTYYGDHPTHKRLEAARWRTFVAENKLKVGDVCVFELIECTNTFIKLKVQILRGDFPSVLLDTQDGTQDKPLVID